MMDPAKVAGVLEWPVPTTKKEVQSFLGFVNFYRRLIEGLSHLTRPLFNPTKNDSIFHWSSDEQTNVVAALSWCFAILVSKFCKIMKIFE
jgi:hypothetical protein